MISTMIWLTINIYHEARGEPIEGQIAVAHTVLNRAQRRHKTVGEVINQKYQYSWTNGYSKIDDYESFVGCGISAMQAMKEHLDGETFHGADHYYADYIKKPSWAEKMEFVGKIGRHLFYKS